MARLDFDAHTSARMTRATVAVDALPARFGKGTAVVVRRAVCTTLAASNYQSGAVRYTVRRCAWPSTSSADSRGAASVFEEHGDSRLEPLAGEVDAVAGLRGRTSLPGQMRIPRVRRAKAASRSQYIDQPALQTAEMRFPRCLE
ncbi:hypothetical protein CFB34_001720 [Burkholderia sp. HI4860]|uniref:hypothetical protein n=1 Tax=Burkholderia sp. HI4860 TaxID=2015361 RepID=UPI00117750F0|nr:hypothetical protein [Burkholderia sp. HI4860]MCI3967741.1 hypothetical protein [Burkholderia sp. HI4860]